MVAHVERKIRGVGFSIDHDVIENTAELSMRGQRSADALNGVQVRMAEAVEPVQSGLAGIIDVPWTEVALGMDLTDGLGIDQLRAVQEGLLVADIAQVKILDVEFQR